MRRWVVIAVTIAAAASSCSTAAKAPAAGSPTVSYSRTPPAASLVSLSGKGFSEIEPIAVPAGKYRVGWAVHDPEGSHYLLIGLIHGTDLQPQNERTWFINAEVPATSTGAAEFESDGKQLIVVVETRPNTYQPTTWTLTVAPLSTPARSCRARGTTRYEESTGGALVQLAEHVVLGKLNQ
jgi:hypothetical protein